LPIHFILFFKHLFLNIFQTRSFSGTLKNIMAMAHMLEYSAALYSAFANLIPLLPTSFRFCQIRIYLCRHRAEFTCAVTAPNLREPPTCRNYLRRHRAEFTPSHILVEYIRTVQYCTALNRTLFRIGQLYSAFANSMHLAFAKIFFRSGLHFQKLWQTLWPWHTCWSTQPPFIPLLPTLFRFCQPHSAFAKIILTASL
jgi:hypothetical protein